jgi:hypothetical protein
MSSFVETFGEKARFDLRLHRLDSRHLPSASNHLAMHPFVHRIRSTTSTSPSQPRPPTLWMLSDSSKSSLQVGHLYGSDSCSSYPFGLPRLSWYTNAEVISSTIARGVHPPSRRVLFRIDRSYYCKTMIILHLERPFNGKALVYLHTGALQ